MRSRSMRRALQLPTSSLPPGHLGVCSFPTTHFRTLQTRVLSPCLDAPPFLVRHVHHRLSPQLLLELNLSADAFLTGGGLASDSVSKAKQTCSFFFHSSWNSPAHALHLQPLSSGIFQKRTVIMRVDSGVRPTWVAILPLPMTWASQSTSLNSTLLDCKVRKIVAASEDRCEDEINTYKVCVAGTWQPLSKQYN